MPEGLYPPAPQPPTGLGRYRKLSTTAGLGGLSIGDKWEPFGFGAMDKDPSFKLMDAYFEAGGNFIDTANHYQDERSEMFIGEWAEQRGIRDQLFIATKYSTNFKRHDDNTAQKVLLSGSNAKSLHLSKPTILTSSTLHWWDWDTSLEEVMRNLHNLIVQGKVLYLGISDTPAWVVARANQFARDNGLTPFVIYQGAWNVLERSFERDIIPMARAEGMALAPFNVLGGGKIRTDEEEQRRIDSGENGRALFGDWKRNDKEKAVCGALEKVAKEIGAKSITSIAIAYLMHKTTHVFPIVGGRKVEHLMANLEALEISLTREHIKAIESAVEFDIGFPGWFIGNNQDPDFTFFLVGNTAVIDRDPLPEVITPKKTS
ncbi:NADP-dependent oxidoreductase domain-containing protein [Coprinopsis sp. MPI-PUGE-AT-0042]|nr:NADP-dependent oxidoreductase domain-containing protein [Coprinopsis sp. MPI-PUGE-AT-0042]